MSRTLDKSYRWVIVLLSMACLTVMRCWSAPLVATPRAIPTRAFKVCLLLMESQKNVGSTAKYWNPDPWILPVLNSSPLKPEGWILDNPLAPGILPYDPDLENSGAKYAADGKGNGRNWYTNDDKTSFVPLAVNIAGEQITLNIDLPDLSRVRFSSTIALPGGLTSNTIYYAIRIDATHIQVAATYADALAAIAIDLTDQGTGIHTIEKLGLTKDDPAYWVVKLDQSSIDALSQFDLVIVNGHSRSTLSNTDRDNLQLLLDRGGTIWLNNSQREGANLSNFFLDPPIVLNPGGYDDTGGTLGMTDPDSWLLNGYYKLTEEDLAYLRDNTSKKSFIASGLGGLIGEIVRLYPAPDGNPAGNPAIAEGRVGAGELIVTGTDVIGGLSDWWEYWHNNSGWGPNTLGTIPYNQTPPTENPSQELSYLACAKFIFNMLDRPSSWHMVGGNEMATHFSPQGLSTSLVRNGISSFTTIFDPVSFGNYVAAAGEDPEINESQLRVYQISGGGADQTFRHLYSIVPPPDDPNPHVWIGSPVIGRVIQPGGTIPVTAIYGLEETYDDKFWYLTPHCYRADTGEEIIWTAPGEVLKVPYNPAGRPSASITLSKNRLVITVFGKVAYQSYDRIFIVDASTGATGAEFGGDIGWGTDFRLTGPASIISAQVDLELAPSETSDLRVTGNGVVEHRKELMEMLAVSGEAYPNINGQPAVFLIPPMAVVQMNYKPKAQRTVPSLSGASQSLTLQGRYPIGISNSAATDMRKRKIVAVKNSGTTLRIIFRTFDLFVSHYLPAELSATENAQLMVSYTPTGLQPVTLTVPRLAMGYPIVLRGTQRFSLENRLSLRLTDGDGASTFGYTVDNPLVMNGNAVIVGTNCLLGQGKPFLTDYRAQDIGQQEVSGPTDPLLDADIAVGGGLTSYRLATPELTKVDFPQGRSYGDENWQFCGNNFGPLLRERISSDVPATSTVIPVIDATNFTVGNQLRFVKRANPVTSQIVVVNAVDVQQNTISISPGLATDYPKALTFINNALDTDQFGIPLLWHSDFPFSAAVGKDSVYTIGTYNGIFSGSSTGEMGDELPLPANNMGSVVYALDNNPSKYLQQVVTAGEDVSVVTGSEEQLSMTQTAVGPLRVGARALLKYAAGVFDIGTITKISKGDGDFYIVTFSRPCPTFDFGDDATLLVSTSSPYLSHVQGWDRVSGAEVVGTNTRISQGICSTFLNPPDGPGPANPYETTHGEVMISFTQLHTICHEPSLYVGTTLTPPANESAFPANWQLYPHLVLPRLSLGSQSTEPASTPGGTYMPAKTVVNYVVDYRAGRIELNPEIAGQYADRFVVVHYLTMEKVGGIQQQVRHAEIMHIPSQIKWQYAFNNVVPDSAPVVVNDTVYVTANKLVPGTQIWQPMIYAFDAHPENSLQVQPKWAQPVGPSITSNILPYRGVTSVIPTASGILVGTSLPNIPGNQLTLFSDRGTLIADGHRIIRTDGGGQLTWQASATVGKDFRAQGASVETKEAALVQQDFVLISRIRRLDNGNILVCDTGGNRIVEMDRNGNVIWQYPDSGLFDGSNQTTPKSLRLNEPRDVRRYTRDIEGINIEDDLGVQQAASIHWDVTLIADTGNNRILEIRRPLVRLEGETEYSYQPEFTLLKADGTPGDNLSQIEDVIADGKTTQLYDAVNDKYTPLAEPLSFSTASRYASYVSGIADNDAAGTELQFDTLPARIAIGQMCYLAEDPGTTYVIDSIDPANSIVSLTTQVSEAHIDGVWVFVIDEVLPNTDIPALDGVQSRRLLAAVGNPVNDPLIKGADLRTVELIRETPIYQMVVNKPALAANGANALRIRRDHASDFVGVRQLDLITLLNASMVPEVHALVVDQSGVREVPVDESRQTTPVFEMAQTQYTNALLPGKWNSFRSTLTAGDQTKLDNWLSDKLFAPVAVMRLDPGSKSTTDQAQVRYLISQMNTLTPQADGNRRIHLFEARYDALNGWGIIDPSNDFYIYPNPLSPEYPNLPGMTYPLTQPLSIDRD